VVAEALANVAKYARATEATVAVRRANGQMTIDVTDDGVGGPTRLRTRDCADSPTGSPRSTARPPWTAAG
jgi:signal transduction histidine kinase